VRYGPEVGAQEHGFSGGAPLFACRVRHDGAQARVGLHGEVDLAARPELDAMLETLTDGAERVVVDLTAVTFMDSTGLHWLVRVHDAVARAGATLQVAVADGPVRDVLALTGVDRLLAPAPARIRE
jgi:anti-sigma B factor antagonist